MVGRASELGRLVGMLGARPTPAVALVAGEAGVGKTRLVQELVATAPPETRVLAGQADPGTVGRPMELFLDALDPTPTGEQSELVDAARDPVRSAEERIRAGVALVRSLTAGVTGLLVFEDLHWADPESVSVFERLAEPDGGRLLLVGTYRPDGLSRRHPASQALPRLERRHSVTHLHLDRLSPAEVGEFLSAVHGQDPSFRVVDALHTRTGGNPFFLEELVASTGEVPYGELHTMPLPWTVAELVRSELDELDGGVRAMITAASVLGRRVSFDLLIAVTGADEDDLIRQLRVAVDRGLLVETEPDVFGFHHELAREAIESGLLGRERRRLHEAALAALRWAGSGDHVALAHHAGGAGRYDDMVDAARLGAHESLDRGSTYQALQLAETGLVEAEDDIDLLATATRAAWLAGILDAAAEHGDTWLRRARAVGDAGSEAAALGLCARVSYEQGDLGAMSALTDALIGVIDRLDDDVPRSRAMADVAQSTMLREQIDAACAWAERALALADAHGLADVRAAAIAEKGSALLLDPERAGEGRALLEAAIAEAERAGEHVLAARSLNNLVWQARRWLEADEVRALIERMRRQAEAAGFDALAITDATIAYAHVAAVEGDLHAAIGHIDEGRRAGTSRAGWATASWPAVFRAGLALEVGDIDEAARLADEVKPHSRRAATGVIGLDFHIACRRGDLAGARERLDDLVAAADQDGFTSPSQVHDLLSAALDAGLDPDEVRPLVDRAGYYVGHRLGDDQAWRRMLDAQLAEVDGRIEEAAGLYADAAATLGSAPEILAGHRGTAHVGAARCLTLLGRHDQARAHAGAGATHLARWGGWRVDHLEAVERRLGLGTEVDGPPALTPREREVTALLTEGLTNAQLAERLYISPRTAAVHVSNILAKLGMTSRAEVAAWAARGGQAEADRPGPDGVSRAR